MKIALIGIFLGFLTGCTSFVVRDVRDDGKGSIVVERCKVTDFVILDREDCENKIIKKSDAQK